jgi:hypothetical protein
VHESGEPIDFVRDADEDVGTPAAASATLRDAVMHLAVAAMLARHWPSAGTRQTAALAAAGFLLRGGLTEEIVHRIVTSIEMLVGDPEDVERRAEAVRDTAAKLKAGQPVTGGTTLAEALIGGEGKKIIARLGRWLPRGAEMTPPEPAQAGPQLRQRVPLLAREGDLLVASEEAWKAVAAANDPPSLFSTP